MSAFTVFSAYLSEIEATAYFFRDAAQLRPRLGAHLNWDAAGAEEKKLFGTFMGRAPAEDRVYGPLVVSICAGLEQFTADLIDEACEVLTSRKLSALQVEKFLPGILRKQRRFAGYPLDRVDEPRSYWKIGYDELVLSLASTVESSTNVVFYGRAFAVNIGGVDAESLERALARVSITIPWADICKSKEVQSALGTTAQAETLVELKAMLAEIARLRNSLAHSQGSEIVGFEKVIRILLACRSFSRELSVKVLAVVK